MLCAINSYWSRVVRVLFKQCLHGRSRHTKCCEHRKQVVNLSFLANANILLVPKWEAITVDMFQRGNKKLRRYFKDGI